VPAEEEDEVDDPNVEVFAARVLRRLHHELDEVSEGVRKKECIWKAAMGVAPDAAYFVSPLRF
jgi:hypothetical protein